MLWLVWQYFLSLNENNDVYVLLCKSFYIHVVDFEACEARAFSLQQLWDCGSKNSAYCVSPRETELQFMDTEKIVNHTLLRTVLFSVKMKLVLSEAPERLFFSPIFVVDL